MEHIVHFLIRFPETGGDFLRRGEHIKRSGEYHAANTESVANVV